MSVAVSLLFSLVELSLFNSIHANENVEKK